jgi:hypothetical protein
MIKSFILLSLMLPAGHQQPIRIRVSDTGLVAALHDEIPPDVSIHRAPSQPVLDPVHEEENAVNIRRGMALQKMVEGCGGWDALGKSLGFK